MSQIQLNTIEIPIIKIDEDMVEIFWSNKEGKSFITFFPRYKAEIFLQKHLIPREQLELISNVGIREII